LCKKGRDIEKADVVVVAVVSYKAKKATKDSQNKPSKRGLLDCQPYANQPLRFAF
jgi:hypothetical protein